MPSLSRAGRFGGIVLFLSCISSTCAGLAQTAVAQTGAASTAPPSAGASGQAGVSALLQPALLTVQHMVGQLRTARWKTPNEVRATADRNLASIQRDLLETLPELLTQADASPGSVPQAFAVYRNVDALYDVLLRVSGTARRAAPEAEAAALESALETLESARKQLGDAIAAEAQDREGQIVKLQAAVKAAAAAPPPVEKAAVVEDGPQQPAVKKKRKAAKPAAQPSANSAAPPANPAPN